MFNKKAYKKIMITILALSMVFGSLALASEGIHSKKLDAVFGRIKFSYKGNDVTDEIEKKYATPGFTVNNRAYVPVRSIADLLAMDIDYDHKSYTVNIVDPLVNEKNQEIRALKRKINKLKGIKEDISTETHLENIKEKLNKQYARYEKVDFDIVLEEGEDDIFIEVKTDLTETNPRKNWIEMKHGKKEDLIKDIVFQINELLPEYNIEGNIYDLSIEENLYSFYQKESQDLKIINKDYIDQGYYYDRYYDYSDNKNDVEIEVRNGFRSKEIMDAKLYRLDYTSKTATFEVEFSNEYKKTWERLDQEEKQEMLEAIVEKLAYENKHIEKIYGEIFMGVKRVGRYEKENKALGKFYEES